MANHQERVNYVVTKDGTYVGYTVNHPCVVQAESLEELKKYTKLLYAEYLKYLVHSATQADSLDFKEISMDEWYAKKRL